jgi:hypothetical protein
MPGDPKECREHAKNCWALAAAASQPDLKSHFTDMAQRWARLASDLEKMDELLHEWGVKLPDKKAG